MDALQIAQLKEHFQLKPKFQDSNPALTRFHSVGKIAHMIYYTNKDNCVNLIKVL